MFLGTNTVSRFNAFSSLHCIAKHFFSNPALPGWVDMRSKYMFSKPDDHDSVLPILIVRDPYYWYAQKLSALIRLLLLQPESDLSDLARYSFHRFTSMCESPYLMKWPHTEEQCPNLVKDPQNDVGVPAKTRWGKVYDREVRECEKPIASSSMTMTVLSILLYSLTGHCQSHPVFSSGILWLTFGLNSMENTKTRISLESSSVLKVGQLNLL